MGQTTNDDSNVIEVDFGGNAAASLIAA